MEKTITIEDVAKIAGVSRATAGRVVGGYGNVSEGNREKVLEAVKKLNYRPNIVAQGLRGQSTKTIAVILGSIKNNYCNKLIYAVEKEAQSQGYNVIVCNTHESVEQEIRHLQNMYSRQVDGIVVMSAFKANEEIPEIYQSLYHGDTPLVLVDRNVRGFGFNVIQSNNMQISYDATKYLIELGHRRIGVLATDEYSTVNERIKGYRKALEEYGISYEKELVEFVGKRDEKGLFPKLLDRNKEMTALYVLNNNMCINVLMELKKRQMTIPEDLSLLVWDDEDMNDLMDITSVEQPVEDIGRAAVECLLDKSRQRQYVEKILNARIVYRKSCKDLRTHNT